MTRDRTPVEPSDFPFKRSLYRPHRALLGDSLADAVSVDSTRETIEQIVQSLHGYLGPITEINFYYYTEDARLPLGPTTYIVFGRYPESIEVSVLGFVSPGA